MIKAKKRPRDANMLAASVLSDVIRLSDKPIVAPSKKAKGKRK